MKLKGLHHTRFFYFGVFLLVSLCIVIGLQRYKSKSEFIPTHTDETKTILLEKSSDTNQLIIFENERIIISIGYDQYLSYKNSDVKLLGFSHIVESHSDEIESFFENGVVPNTFSAQDDLMVEMLNSGKVSIYDKQTKSELISIIEHYQNDIWCPVCGGGRINFYFPDGTLLYKGPEWNF